MSKFFDILEVFVKLPNLLPNLQAILDL